MISLGFSLLLLDSFWEESKLDVAGEIVVAVPARDFLVATGREDKNGLEVLKILAEKVSAQAPYRLTSKLFVWRGGNFQVFRGVKTFGSFVGSQVATLSPIGYILPSGWMPVWLTRRYKLTVRTPLFYYFHRTNSSMLTTRAEPSRVAFWRFLMNSVAVIGGGVYVMTTFMRRASATRIAASMAFRMSTSTVEGTRRRGGCRFCPGGAPAMSTSTFTKGRGADAEKYGQCQRS